MTKSKLTRADVDALTFEGRYARIEAGLRVLHKKTTGKDAPLPVYGPGYDMPSSHLSRVADLLELVGITWDEVEDERIATQKKLTPPDGKDVPDK